MYVQLHSSGICSLTQNQKFTYIFEQDTHLLLEYK